MQRYILTATTSKTLAKQVDAFNALDPIEPFEHRKCYCNWGREGDRGTWFAHGAYGRDLKTGLSFGDVVSYVQKDIDLTVEMINDAVGD